MFPATIRRLIEFEQVLLDRRQDEDTFFPDVSDLDEKYAPERGEVFPLDAYLVHRSLLHWWSAPDFPLALEQLFLSSPEHLLLLVHPASRQHYAELIGLGGDMVQPYIGPGFQATATSSSRSVLAWQTSREATPFIAKLSLDASIGGTSRTILNSRVAKSVGVTSILNSHSPELPPNLGYWPECFGIAPKRIERGGMLIRSIPASVIQGSRIHAPIFALYSLAGGRKPPRFVELAQAAQMSVTDYIHVHLLKPFAQQWVLLTLFGWANEPHSQNLLMEFDHNWQPTGVLVHRDFEDASIDLAFRHKFGLDYQALPFLTNHLSDYQQADLHKWIEMSLGSFFEHGLLWPLGRALDEWHQAAGIIIEHNNTWVPLRNIFRRELQWALDLHTDVPIRFVAGDYRSLARAIVRYRERF